MYILIMVGSCPLVSLGLSTHGIPGIAVATKIWHRTKHKQLGQIFCIFTNIHTETICFKQNILCHRILVENCAIFLPSAVSSLMIVLKKKMFVPGLTLRSTSRLM